MCGIGGIFRYHDAAAPVSEAELLGMRECMGPRGPDGAGLWIAPDGRIGLAQRRLAILDLSEAGAQPMRDPKTGNVVVFHPEIYNYRALGRDLEVGGISFCSSSDAEVLLALYASEGPGMLGGVRSVFAFCLWDA